MSAPIAWMCYRFFTVLLPFSYRIGVVFLSFLLCIGYLSICIGQFFDRFLLIAYSEMCCWYVARGARMYSIVVGASCPQDGQLMAALSISWAGLGNSWAGLGVSWAGLGSSWAGLGISGAGLINSWAELGISWDGFDISWAGSEIS